MSAIFDGLNALMLTRAWETALRPHGVTLSQVSVLDRLAGGAITIGDLARRERIRHSVASVTVTRLEYLGLVRRERGSEDKRRNYVALTIKGEKLLVRLADLAIAALDHDQE